MTPTQIGTGTRAGAGGVTTGFDPSRIFVCGHSRSPDNSRPAGHRKDGSPIARCRVCYNASRKIRRQLTRAPTLLDEAREGLSLILRCTPAATNSYDCGDPFEIARVTLAKLSPSAQPGTAMKNDSLRKLWGCTVCWGSGFTMTGEPCPFVAQHRSDESVGPATPDAPETAQSQVVTPQIKAGEMG